MIRRDDEIAREFKDGLGPNSAGQSGDTQGISGLEEVDSESVRELLEEGQAFEASVVSGVENAADADAGGKRAKRIPIKEVPEDDVPQEYIDQDVPLERD